MSTINYFKYIIDHKLYDPSTDYQKREQFCFMTLIQKELDFMRMH